MISPRPTCTVVLAMTADGKIADYQRQAARFGSAFDKIHLEHLIAQVDGVLIGAGTLRAYGTSLPIRDRDLLKTRQDRHQPLQPVHLICSRSGQIDVKIPFFRQSLPRWLATTAQAAQAWPIDSEQGFSRILILDENDQDSDQHSNQHNEHWRSLFTELWQLGWRKLIILGGGQLVASLLAANLIDDLWLTICPFLLGGTTAPTPVEGVGFLAEDAKKLKLLSLQQIEQEIFVHYEVQALEGV
jgi:5-amino-6-(5-phosphoribosylamino)uracil reductase